MICRLSGSIVDSSSPVKIYVFCGTEPECIDCIMAGKPLVLPDKCPKCGHVLQVDCIGVYCENCNEAKNASGAYNIASFGTDD